MLSLTEFFAKIHVLSLLLVFWRDYWKICWNMWHFVICEFSNVKWKITPHHSRFLQAGCPSWCPTNSVKALKAIQLIINLNCENFDCTSSSFSSLLLSRLLLPSVLWLCWLGGRKGIRPVKNRGWVLAWLSVWSEVQTCIWSSWCHCHSLSLASAKIQIGFTFLVPAHPGGPEKGPLNGCVCVCVVESVG